MNIEKLEIFINSLSEEEKERLLNYLLVKHLISKLAEVIAKINRENENLQK